jgi:hypothetical protein
MTSNFPERMGGRSGCFSDSPGNDETWYVREFSFFLQFMVFLRFFLSLLPVIAIVGGSFSVGVFFDGTLHAAVHVRGRVSFCTTLYVTVRYCTVLEWLGFHEFLIQSNPLSLDTFRRLPLLAQAHQHLGSPRACEWLRSGRTFF